METIPGDGATLKPLTRVVAGNPSYIPAEKIGGFGQSLEPLARFPQGSYLAQPLIERLPPDAAFAWGGEWTDFNFFLRTRFLALASSRVFNNGSLGLIAAEHPEDRAQNLELCIRVIEYLQGPQDLPPDQRRRRCIFFEDGQLVDHFDDLPRAFTRQNQPIPHIDMGALQEKLVNLGNNLLERIQNEDIPNKLLRRKSTLAGFLWFFLMLASIAACWFLLQRVFASRKPGNTPPPPTVLSASSGPPGVFDRRQKELLRRNNIYEPIRDLIREFFATTGAHGEEGAKLPKIRISDVVRKPESLQLAVKDLWRLAYGSPQIMTVGRWRELEPYFERVCQAFVDGKWAFVLESSNWVPGGTVI